MLSPDVELDTVYFFAEDYHSIIEPQLKLREEAGLSKVTLSKLSEPVPISDVSKTSFSLENLSTTNIFPYKVACLGGTFDHIHAGHKVII